MNFGDILSYFKSRTGGANIDRAQVARLVDEAQIEIAKRHGVIVRKGYYSVEKGEGYDLPPDHLQTEEIRDGENQIRFDYEITPDGKIFFYANGDYALIYTRMPRPIDKEDNDAEPDVHPIFHSMIVQYCVARWWEDFAEGIPAEETKARNMLNDFYRKVDEAVLVLRKRPYTNIYLDVHPLVRGL